MAIDNGPWSSLLNEGLAMLGALADDMMRCGIEVHTVLEHSISQHTTFSNGGLTRSSWSPISYSPNRSVEEIAVQWTHASRCADAAIVIAPELDGTLEHIVSCMRNQGITVLAGDSCFMQTACDQWHTCSAWKSAGVRHPATWLLSAFLSEWSSENHSINSQSPLHDHGAWVVKRRDSAGCVGQRRYRELGLLIDDIGKSREFETGREKWIVQPWVCGTPASLAVMCHEGGRQEGGLVLGCFEQQVESTSEGDETSFGYFGGSGPIEGITQDQLQEFAGQVLEALPGYPLGWIGIDFIIEPDGRWTAMEVNPRLTSSYLGYRKWYGPELAKFWFRGIPPRRLFEEFPKVSFSLEDWER